MRMIFVNLPVKDLEASRRFYAGLGFVQNQQFSDDTAISMVIEDNIVVMLLTEPKFRSFITGEIADTSKGKEALICLSADSRAEVDGFLAKALANGGQPWMPPQDHGVMYGVSFQDPDGHVWEVMWMDPAVVQPGPGVAATEPA
ncbi:VOC family protein [Phenylobacterium sp.]|uniref:VOC family protein n=1 Tax=Phenylobacterium sp. TaxID=1871053 RepID=UPI0035AECEC0